MAIMLDSHTLVIQIRMNRSIYENSGGLITYRLLNLEDNLLKKDCLD